MVSSNSTASQRYLSTRGGSIEFTFEAAVLKGLADDGGLFIPEDVAPFPTDWKSRWKNLSFQDLAVEICSMYISADEIPRRDLERIVKQSYDTFRAPDITPLKALKCTGNIHVLELFHGPTFAFKDIALQFLGNIFEYFLERKNRDKSPEETYKLTVIGATSGDTGSAAIYGLRGKKNVSVFILHPKGKISPIQEAQMTTVLDENIHNIAVSGTFDDCQDMVKKLFTDREFNKRYNLGAINSINWARILAQMVYYVYSYLQVEEKLKRENIDILKVRFAVPTGNFGDVLAGYYAKRMGLPIEDLVISTNENDILHRFWQSGRYEIMRFPADEAAGGMADDGSKAHVQGVKETYSPAMDILVSSNFERLLWYLAYENGESTLQQGSTIEDKRSTAGTTVAEWMNTLKLMGSVTVPKEVLTLARRDFLTERVSDDDTLSTIRAVYQNTLSQGDAYVLDPHSAVGVTAANRISNGTGANDHHYICLATAHPAKFSHAVGLALKEEQKYSYEAIQPLEFQGLAAAEKRILTIDAPDENLIKDIIQRSC